jgi:putative oxidoreductase
MNPIERFPDVALLVARVIMGAAFLMGFAFKVMMPAAQAASITAAGIPFGGVLIWVAAVFELGLVIAFFTGAYFRAAAALAILYVLFLAVMFHGPRLWGGNPMEFGFFVDHFTMCVGLIYMSACGPGALWVLRLGERREALTSGG